jgi:hypothetical protein
VRLAIAVRLAGCGGSGTGSGGFFDVTYSEERLEVTAGGGCAVKGTASKLGNLTAKVELEDEALSGSGAVLGTSTAAFEVAGFSRFEFSSTKGNQQGQPSSGEFSNGLACADIPGFKRTRTSATKV